ncbi:MAG: valine--tRNA ligase [Candidatus Delongbacteria bacterium]|nr:valine--tRNA ligase [Candidatus Delongbacteria bacterium]
MLNLADRYDPSSVENKWYDYWLSQKMFHAEPSRDKPPYTIVIPPPNITGVLHMGHVLNNTLQDILIRWKKMQGFNTEWLPGTDHAAIATQNVLEKMLRKEGKTKDDIGREAFTQLFWDWRNKSGGTIIKQLKLLGASCDWEREAFTMDANLTRAVQEVFIRLYNKGLVYRGKYIINWCPRCGTALSDDETDYAEKQSHLWHIRYHFKDEPEKYLVVATTRPETMLGDTAVAVNPKDERFTALIGRKLILPIVNREIPIIADDFVDPSFGTGCVKVTPAHDPNDFQMAMRHPLEKIVVIDSSGKMNDQAGIYQGLDRFECRTRLVEDLKSQNYLESIQDYTHSVGHCYRCNTVIEPHLSDQWFVKMGPLAQPVIQAIENDQIKFYPERWKKNALNWLYNIRDWCISRQIWLGHKIPIWYCPDHHVTASIPRPEKCPICGSTDLVQDPDVLDTWFSSWLWPFSTFGWPEKNKDLDYFYPTSTLVTDPGIIFFWVIRMIMAGYEFMGNKPFSEVHLHGVVCDEQGRKMSKSLGNSPDPIDIIQTYSADAMRFAIIFSTPPGQNTLYSDKQTEMGRNFTNKIWNAFRLVMMNIEDFSLSEFHYDPSRLTLPDQWLLHRLNHAIDQINADLKEFRFNEAEHAIYDFIWKDYCDWYLEINKLRWYQPVSDQDKAMSQYLCIHIMQAFLKLLHPFMPFLTEEIWQSFKSAGLLTRDQDKLSIMAAQFPQVDPACDFPEAFKEMEFLMELISQIRNIRSEKNIKPKDKVNLVLKRDLPVIAQNQAFVGNLAKVDQISISDTAPADSAVGVVGDLEFYIPLSGLVDLGKEKEKIEKEIKQLAGYLQGLNQKLQNEKFVSGAPAEVVAKEKARRDELQAKYDTLQQALAKMS